MKNGFIGGPSPKSEYKVNTLATRPVQEKTRKEAPLWSPSSHISRNQPRKPA